MSAVQRHYGMSVSFFINNGDRLDSPVNAVPPALPVPEPGDMSHITQQDTVVLRVIDLDYQLLLEFQSVAAKSQGQYKAETYLMSRSQSELAQLNSASAKLVALQRSKQH